MPIPNVDNINAAHELYQKCKYLQVSDQIIMDAVNNYPNHDSLDMVRLKIDLMNALYNAGVIASQKMAEHIIDLNRTIRLEQLISSGDDKAVNKIRYLKVARKTVDCYIFATKYCHFHNSQKFPMCDKFVIQALKRINGRGRPGILGFNNGLLDKRVYSDFRRIIVRLLNNLPQIDFKQIDIYLWLLGQKISNRQVSQIIRQLFSENQDLVNRLEPIE